MELPENHHYHHDINGRSLTIQSPHHLFFLHDEQHIAGSEEDPELKLRLSKKDYILRKHIVNVISAHTSGGISISYVVVSEYHIYGNISMSYVVISAYRMW